MASARRAISIHPPELLDGFAANETGRAWWVAYTKVRQEKRLAEELAARQIPFYLPLVERRHLYRGRRITSHVPLFAGYVFLFTDQRERVQSLATQRIAQSIQVPDGPHLYADLAQVQRLIDAKVPLTIEARLQPGQKVRVLEGSFAGMEGIIESRCRKTRLIVAITLLQRGVSVELDDVLLEPLDSACV